MFWNRIIGRSNDGYAQASIFAPSGEFGARSPAMKRFIGPQRPGVLECGGCEGQSVAPLHSRSVRCDQLNFRSSTRSSARLQSCNTSGWGTRIEFVPEDEVHRCPV